MSELLPCPFCGKPPESESWQDWWNGQTILLGHIWCESCNISTSQDGDVLYETAKEVWNRRRAAPGVVEVLTEAISLIRFWHGQGHMAGAEPFLWACYQESPEMKRIQAALAALRAAEGGDRD